jgi:hypothetical protein
MGRPVGARFSFLFITQGAAAFGQLCPGLVWGAPSGQRAIECLPGQLWEKGRPSKLR